MSDRNASLINLKLFITENRTCLFTDVLLILHAWDKMLNATRNLWTFLLTYEEINAEFLLIKSVFRWRLSRMCLRT